MAPRAQTLAVQVAPTRTMPRPPSLIAVLYASPPTGPMMRRAATGRWFQELGEVHLASSGAAGTAGPTALPFPPSFPRRSFSILQTTRMTQEASRGRSLLDTLRKRGDVGIARRRASDGRLDMPSS